MNRVIYAFFTLSVLASCAGSYNIQGTSNVSNLDGQMLYLKVLQNQDLSNVDSCDIIHGRFTFTGTVDSVKMASIYINDESVLPLVLENGDITIQITQTQQVVSGTPLNDKLFTFIRSYDQLQNQQMELVHKHDRAIMDGSDMEQVSRQLNEEYIQINEKLDKLITSFIVDNFDNVLGPGVFMMVTNNYPYPMFSPWIDDVMSKATPTFKNDSYVKWYMETAERVQNIQNGMETLPPSQGTHMTNAPAPPTPNQLAHPTGKEKNQ